MNMREGTNHSDGDKPAVPSNSLLDRIREIEAIMLPLRKEMEELKQRQIEGLSEFSVGDVIEWNNGKRKGRIIQIAEWCVGIPMWRVVLIRKDGSDGCSTLVRRYQKPNRSNPTVDHRPTGTGEKQ